MKAGSYVVCGNLMEDLNIFYFFIFHPINEALSKIWKNMESDSIKRQLWFNETHNFY